MHSRKGKGCAVRHSHTSIAARKKREEEGKQRECNGAGNEGREHAGLTTLVRLDSFFRYGRPLLTLTFGDARVVMAGIVIVVVGLVVDVVVVGFGIGLGLGVVVVSSSSTIPCLDLPPSLAFGCGGCMQ